MRSLEIDLLSKKYKLFIKRNAFSEIGQYLAKHYKDKKIAVITDDHLNALYGSTIKAAFSENGLTGRSISIKPGEESKNMDTLQQIYKALSEFRIGRSDLILSFGGGVVGDLSGFAASTYLRGIPYIQVPTSLLAQVDSSIGGKVAVDLPWGKNLVGSFYHPEAVFIDPDLLKTLARRFLHDGLGEVIKYGCISDAGLFNKLLSYENDDALLADIEDIIYTCCQIKKTIVEKDEKDFGERMLLNFGHTLGHAIEKYFEYNRYTHGEAVALGMHEITKNSQLLGLTEGGTVELLETVLKKYELPFELPQLEKSEICRTISLDKKSSGDSIHLILLKKIGEAFIKKVGINEIDAYI